MKIDADKVVKLVDTAIMANRLNCFFFNTGRNKAALRVLEKLRVKLTELIETEQKEEDLRAERQANYKIDIDMFDECDLFTNCTVQVLHNTITDEYSVGWWQN